MLVLSETAEEIVVAVARGTDPDATSRAANVWAALRPGARMRFATMSEADLVLRAAAGSEESRDPLDERGFETVENDKDAPAVALLNAILLEADELGASDIHIERSGARTSLRMRIAGSLETIRSFDGPTGKGLSVRVKLLANLNTPENRKPQDGKFRLSVGPHDLDIRVSTLPCDDGESTVLRFLNSLTEGISLDRLGFPEQTLEYMRRAASLPQGLIVVAGPTGCGKTTTLAALAKYCDPIKKKIVSVEDPIEYRIPGVTQVQTNDAIGLDFSSILRRILRQDPDVIIVGEIRDGETAKLAIRAALTGHLVFTTLHVSNAREASIRLENLGVARFLVEATLRCVIAQRLVRLVQQATAAVEGFSGRAPIGEIIYMPFRAEARFEKTFREAIHEALREKITTSEEILRVFGEEA